MKRTILAFIAALVFGSCQRADNSVIDTLHPISVDLSYFDKDSTDISSLFSADTTSPVISDSFSVKVSDSRNFKFITVTVTNLFGQIITQANYYGSGSGVVSGLITTTVTPIVVGDLTFSFTAYNTVGVPGNSVSHLLHLYNSKNLPPIIDSVQVPDSVQLDPSTTILLRITAGVHDPNGLLDISHVYFNSYKPDGSPSTNNPFYMYDDGTHGDAVPGDGIYTLTIQLPPTTPTGTYKFVFYCIDRSNALSSPVTHFIKVYQ
ncbi:MAG: choice-of-anchor X domain-containing protein [Candidatus Kryptoniota bacterium]